MNCFNPHRRRTDPKIDRELITRVVMALRAGESNDWIIENIGTCRATITRLVKRYKIEGRKPGRKRKWNI